MVICHGSLYSIIEEVLGMVLPRSFVIRKGEITTRDENMYPAGGVLWGAGISFWGKMGY